MTFVAMHNHVQLPLSVGTKTKAESLSITIASDDTIAVTLDAEKGAGPTTAETLRVVVANDQTLPVSAVSLPLPTDAATEAKQDAGNTKLDTANGLLFDISDGVFQQLDRLPAALGQTAMAGSLAVTVASDQTAIPASQSGVWNVTNISGTVSLPTGAATAANQATANVSLASIDTKTPALGQAAMAASSPVVIASNQTALPVAPLASVVSTLNSTAATLAAGAVFTGLSEEVKDYGTISIEVFSNVASATDGLSVEWSTDATNWDDVDVFTVIAGNGRFFTFGPEARYFRLRYTNGASPQTTFRLQTIFHYGYIKPSSHRLNETLSDDADAELVKAAPALRVTANTYITQAGDANANAYVTLRSPSGAVDYNTGAASASTIRTVLATRHEAVATPLAVTLSSGTAAIAYDTGVSNANTVRTVLATRHESASTPVAVRITNGTSFGSPAETGRAFADSARKDYSAGSVTTGAWTQLIASTAAVINYLMVTDQSGECMELGVGAAASETRFAILPRGFSGVIPIAIAAGTRVSVRAVSATASSGELVIGGYQ